MLKLADAIWFAKIAHEGQLRKGGEPYFNHPFRVMLEVSGITRDEDVLCAAVLHDILEDTKCDFDDLNLRFGFAAASLVVELTNKDDMALKRAERIAAREEKYKTFSEEASLIKLADRLDNVSDLKSCDHSWALKYSDETRSLLQAIPYHNSHFNLRHSIIDKLSEA